MPSDDKAITRVIKYLRKSLGDLSDVLQDTVDQINDFSKSLKKAENDIKGIKVVKGKTVSTSSVKLTPEIESADTAKTQAATTLFSLLGGVGAKTSATPAAMKSPSASISGPPKRPGPPAKAGPPSRPPTKAGPPSRPPAKAGLPSKNLPPPPKLPPAPGTAGPPPKAAAVVKTPSFAKRTGPPSAPSVGATPSTLSPAPAVASQAGGSLSTLRDEMLDELNRLKKIMRGD